MKATMKKKSGVVMKKKSSAMKRQRRLHLVDRKKLVAFRHGPRWETPAAAQRRFEGYRKEGFKIRFGEKWWVRSGVQCKLSNHRLIFPAIDVKGNVSKGKLINYVRK